jgi:hypothetical protein
MIVILKRIAVFLCAILLMYIVFWSCSKGGHMDNDINKPSMQPVYKPTRQLQLNDIELGAQLTKSQVLNNWGLPDDIVGSLFDNWIYKMADGRRLWLLFSWNEPHPLLKAIICDVSGNDREILFNDMNEKKLAHENASKPSRQQVDNEPLEYITSPNMARCLRLNEIKLSAQLTRVQVLVDWGLPDAIMGSGVEYLVYELEDGRHLRLMFAPQSPQPLLKAIVTDANNKESGEKQGTFTY